MSNTKVHPKAAALKKSLEKYVLKPVCRLKQQPELCLGGKA
jgi:hypothetical protein